MTHDEMRRRLAEAMGWTDIITPGERPRMGEDVTGMPPEGHRPSYRTEIPDPLESDRDAALLRVWFAKQGWRITCRHDEGSAWWRLSSPRRRGLRGEATVDAKEEPDYCRRERLAFCRAVLAVLEAAES